MMLQFLSFVSFCCSFNCSFTSSVAMETFCPRHQSQLCRHQLVLFDPEATLEQRNLSCAAAQALNQSSLRWQSLQTSGTRKNEDRTALKETALTTLSPEIANASLIAASSRLFGVSEQMIQTGFLYRSEDGTSNSIVSRKRAKRVDAFDKLVVYDFFHPHETPRSTHALCELSELVSINKNHTHRWKYKRAFVAGEEMELTCAPKTRSGTLRQLSQEFLDSETYRQITASNPLLSISAEHIQGCICPCIKEEKITECACPKCATCEFLLKGVYEGMKSVRSKTECKDPACAAWTACLKDQDSFFDATMCSKLSLEGFDLKSGKKLSIRRFPCCLSCQLDSVLPCESCGIDKVLPTCECFSEPMLSSTEVTWLKQQETVEGKNHDIVTLRFRDYSGTLREAIDLLIKDHKDTAFHQWSQVFNRHQFHLDCEYFDGLTEIVVLADFASAMKLGGGVKVVCESDSTCNLYVVLVLYKINGETLCDYVRFWSPASTSAEFHHHALRIVKERYTSSVGGAPPIVPKLLRIHLWTDGHPSTYKGYPNLGRMGYWPLTPNFDAAGNLLPGFEYANKIEIVHKFFESHHGSGVQDSAGKAARYSLIQQIGFKTKSIFSYHECYIWSLTNQAVPESRTRDGLFSASGTYAWYALSDGLDVHKDHYEIIDLRKKEFKPVKGCSECYVFWARDWDGTNVPRILSRRFPCRCVNCRSGETCGLLAAIGEWKQHDVSIKKTISLEESRRKKAADKENRLSKRKAKAAALSAAGLLAGASAVVAVGRGDGGGGGGGAAAVDDDDDNILGHVVEADTDGDAEIGDENPIPNAEFELSDEDNRSNDEADDE